MRIRRTVKAFVLVVIGLGAIFMSLLYITRILLLSRTKGEGSSLKVLRPWKRSHPTSLKNNRSEF